MKSADIPRRGSVSYVSDIYTANSKLAFRGSQQIRGNIGQYIIGQNRNKRKCGRKAKKEKCKIKRKHKTPKVENSQNGAKELYNDVHRRLR
jgi:hypothetical protein